MADISTSAPAAEDAHEGAIDGLLADASGFAIDETLVDRLRRLRAEQEAAYRAEHPSEGLRERKRRLTRQTISDAATVMFVSRGFDAVKVSDIADRVNVSMKTLYNYFPTKESLVLDGADDLIERLTGALRADPADGSVTEVVVAALQDGTVPVGRLGDDFAALALRFTRLVDDTPSLRAHWLNILDRLARAAGEQIALRIGQHCTDPVPTIAGRALAALVQVDNESRIRHITAGLRGPDLHQAITSDVRTAAQLLEAGLSSLPHGGAARTG